MLLQSISVRKSKQALEIARDCSFGKSIRISWNKAPSSIIVNLPTAIFQRWNRLTKDKPFKCQKCEKSFTANSSLQNHVKLHCGNVKVAGATIEADSSIVASTGVKYPEAKASASGDRVEDTSSGCQFQQLRFHCMHASCGISFKTEDDLRSHLHESNPSFEADYSFLRTSMSQLVGLLGQLVESGDSTRNLSSKVWHFRGKIQDRLKDHLTNI